MKRATTTLVATAALGTEDLVAGELTRLGFARVKRGPGVARFDVSSGLELLEGMRACLHLRTALRVLWPLATFPARDADELYAGARAVEWETFLDRRHTIAVMATTRAAPPLAHAPFVGQRVKDAVVDRLREKQGGRPDVSRSDPDVRLYVHVDSATRGKGGVPAVSVGLDLAGDSLHARGYRVEEGAAPLRETLAAAVLIASGWDGKRPLVDPMCGSGTIAIEAALLACRLAPGRMSRRRTFGFQRWPIFGDRERAAWRELIATADAAALPRAPGPIIASDRDADVVRAGKANAKAAGAAVAASIEWRVGDVRELAPIVPSAAVVSNPPYGERIGGAGEALEGFWRALGGHLRTLDGHTAFLLCPSPRMIRCLGMRPTWQRRLMNGPIPVALCRFELGKQRQRSVGQRAAKVRRGTPR